MSKSDVVKSGHKDFYSVWHDNVASFYANWDKSIPKFHQAATNLAQEYVKAWSNIASSMINIQHEFATKAGVKSNMPDSALKIVHDTTDDLNKVIEVQNTISLASLDAARQNIKTWNESSNAFEELNKGIVDSLAFPINPKNQ